MSYPHIKDTAGVRHRTTQRFCVLTTAGNVESVQKTRLFVRKALALFVCMWHLHDIHKNVMPVSKNIKITVSFIILSMEKRNSLDSCNVQIELFGVF